VTFFSGEYSADIISAANPANDIGGVIYIQVCTSVGYL